MSIDAIFYYFKYIFPAFVFQLVVSEVVFLSGLKRKKFFFLKLAVGIVMLVALMFLSCVIALPLSSVPFGGTLPYLLLFAFTTVAAFLILDESYLNILFRCIAAYALQNLIYRVYCVFELYGLIYKFSVFANVEYPVSASVFSLAVTAVCSVAAYFVFARRMKEKSSLWCGKVFAFAFVTLFVTLFLCSLANGFWWHHIGLCLVVCYFTILACVLILFLLSGMLEKAGMTEEIEVIKHMWEQDKRNYEISHDEIEVINVKCHDLKEKIHLLRTEKEHVDDEELKEIEDAIAVYDCKMDTGCKPLDVILTEKSLWCNKHDVRLSCYADGESLSFMKATDVYSLFGNLLSNAMEAVTGLSDLSERVIAFSVRPIGEMLVVSCENYYDGKNIKFASGLPVTSKEDKDYHGFGVKSMKLLVKKYGGDMTVGADGKVFRVKILLPVPKAKPQKQSKNDVTLQKTSG